MSRLMIATSALVSVNLAAAPALEELSRKAKAEKLELAHERERRRARAQRGGLEPTPPPVMVTLAGF